MAKTEKPKTPRQLMVPIEPFAVPSKDGRPARVISRNTPLWSTDPIVKRHPHLFMTAAESLLGQGQVIHTATANPGVIATAPGLAADDPGIIATAPGVKRAKKPAAKKPAAKPLEKLADVGDEVD